MPTQISITWPKALQEWFEPLSHFMQTHQPPSHATISPFLLYQENWLVITSRYWVELISKECSHEPKSQGYPHHMFIHFLFPYLKIIPGSFDPQSWQSGDNSLCFHVVWDFFGIQVVNSGGILTNSAFQIGLNDHPAHQGKTCQMSIWKQGSSWSHAHNTKSI